MADYCWVVTYHLNTVDPPVILTCERKHHAVTQILPMLAKRFKEIYPRVKWREVNLDKLQTVGVTEYALEAIGNPHLYIKVFRSPYISYLKDLK